jgi:Cdc6-like AAA superfamily ATPase
MVSDIKPNFAITMHGSDKQKQQFGQKVKEAIPQTEVVIMPSYTAQTLSIPSH